MFFKTEKVKVYKDVGVDELDQLIKDENAVLVDVRTPREIAAGVIGKPLLIELGMGMTQKFKDLDKNRKYVLYCRSGKRSVMASKMMAGQGFTDVNNLLGGYNAWKINN